MKNRTLNIIVGCLLLLALFGIFKSISSDPVKFLAGIGIMVLIGFAFYFAVRTFSISSPQRKEQRAFLKAAKKSKKRLQLKGGDTYSKSSSHGTLTSLKKNTKTKKKPPAYLTVIDGKKGKKKNRASL